MTLEHGPAGGEEGGPSEPPHQDIKGFKDLKGHQVEALLYV